MYICNVRFLNTAPRFVTKACQVPAKFVFVLQSTVKCQKTRTMEQTPVSTPPRRVKKKELSNDERMQVMAMLLGMDSTTPVNRPLPYGAISMVAKKFQIGREVVSKMWNKATLSRSLGVVVKEEVISHNGSRRAGKTKWDTDEMVKETKAIPRKKRKTYRALATRLGMPKSTVHRMKQKRKVFVRHSSALKPTLTDVNKLARVSYALEQRDAAEDNKNYENMYDRVHVDEKWFYMTYDGECYILAHDEEPPKRATRHKGYITKIMFIAATARPRRINNQWWDGKIGIWPVGFFRPAERASRNRPRGHPVWENESINKDKYRELMIDYILPAVLAKFPPAYLERHGVRIQQDGASSHIDADDPEWLAAVHETGCKITLETQPANSPDLNINDLAFFRSIQSLYYEAAPENEAELIEAVEDAFEEYACNKLNRMWLTLMSCCNQILETNGDNHYSIVHMNKEKLEREGRLPRVLPVSDAAQGWD